MSYDMLTIHSSIITQLEQWLTNKRELFKEYFLIFCLTYGVIQELFTLKHGHVLTSPSLVCFCTLSNMLTCKDVLFFNFDPSPFITIGRKGNYLYINVNVLWTENSLYKYIK